ncbi:MAG: hypothetical protein RL092_876 [Bacteroidota bacterium]
MKKLLLLLLLIVGSNLICSAQQDTSRVYEWNGISIRYHKVEKGKTLYSISKLYNVKQEDILEINPEANEGLKAGMLLKIPVASTKTPPNTPSKEKPASLKHTVQAKETAFGIAKMYGLTIAELQSFNPGIEKGLQPGMELIVYPSPSSSKKPEKPTKTETSNTTVEEKPVEEPIAKEEVSCRVRSIEDQRKPIQVALMLPFYISPTEELNPKARIGLDFYSGAKLALDSLMRQGLNINVTIFDTHNDSTAVSDALKNPSLSKADLIIGPLYSSAFVKVAEFAKSNAIPAVSPFSQSDALLNNFPNVIKVTPDVITQIQQCGPILKKNHPNAKFTLVRNTNEKDKELADAFKSSLIVSANLANEDFQEVNYSSVSELLTSLSDANENVILFPSTVPVQVIDFIGRLSNNRTGKRITLVGLNDWNNYENIEFDHLNNLNFTCAAANNTNYSSDVARLFQGRFKDEFKAEPTFYAYQGFDVTYYFCLQMAKYGKSLLKCLPEVPPSCGLNSCYRFTKIGEGDGFENQFIYLLEMNNFEMKRKN